MSETSELRQTLLSQGEALHARYRDMLTGGWRQRIPLLTLSASAIVVYLVGLVALGISPIKIISGAGRLIDIEGLMLPPDPDTWSRFLLYLGALGQTLSIAFLGTLLGAIIGCPFGFLAARNVVVNRLVRLLTRRSLDTVRSVDTLIWALIWINVVGLGPFAGALAIMSTDLGAFGKLMSEAIEAADRKPVDGVLSVGGSRLHGVRFGMLPQVLPVFASQLLYFFESNTRSATIIGIVGAGGIGLQLSEQIRVLEWQQVSFLILMVLVTVAALDWISQRLRSAIIGHRPSSPIELAAKRGQGFKIALVVAGKTHDQVAGARIRIGAQIVRRARRGTAVAALRLPHHRRRPPIIALEEGVDLLLGRGSHPRRSPMSHKPLRQNRQDFAPHRGRSAAPPRIVRSSARDRPRWRTSHRNICRLVRAPGGPILPSRSVGRRSDTGSAPIRRLRLSTARSNRPAYRSIAPGTAASLPSCSRLGLRMALQQQRTRLVYSERRWQCLLRGRAVPR